MRQGSYSRDPHRVVAGFDGGWPGMGANAWRHPENAALGQPGQHVDPRGSDLFGGRADDGRNEQPRDVQAGRTQNSQQSIVPDLAESWSWNDDNTRLTF